ncbi:uncharacterized protein [Mytilus edulis]|uniref:uncharacterized protein n=1 Tax=Mytilus edulis TaxID=6550 RepID=UPI0039EE52E0
MIKKFPFKDETLVHVGFLNPVLKDKVSPDCVMKLVDTFPNLLDIDEKSQLQEQFTDYQLTPLDELPKCLSPETDIATFWGEMTKLHDIFSNKARFIVLSKLAKTMLVLPNSNADSERAFSLVKKDSNRIPC